MDKQGFGTVYKNEEIGVTWLARMRDIITLYRQIEVRPLVHMLDGPKDNGSISTVVHSNAEPRTSPGDCRICRIEVE